VRWVSQDPTHFTRDREERRTNALPRLQRRTTAAAKRRSADPERGGHPPQRVTQRGLGEPGHAPGANAGRSPGLGAAMQPRPASGASRKPTLRCDEASSRELRTATCAAGPLGVGCRRRPPMTIGGQARKRGAPRLKGQARPSRPRARQVCVIRRRARQREALRLTDPDPMMRQF
jgi:hypothetical protein